MSVRRLLAVTLVPSAVFFALYIAIGCFWQAVPALVLFFVAGAFTLFPFEVYMVLAANKKAYGSYGIQIAFSKQEKVPWWKIILYGLVLFGIAGLAFITVAPLENMLMAGASDKLNAILPAYFDWNNFGLMKQYSKGMLIFTSVFYMLMNVFLCPAIEEIYFRGYLTDSLEQHGSFAPILVTVAFSFYHWWLPFQNLFRICSFGVAAVVAYKKMNIYISMVFHSLCNLFSSISFIWALLN